MLFFFNIVNPFVWLNETWNIKSLCLICLLDNWNRTVDDNFYFICIFCLIFFSYKYLLKDVDEDEDEDEDDEDDDDDDGDDDVAKSKYDILYLI